MSVIDEIRKMRERIAPDSRGVGIQLFLRPEDRVFVWFLWDGRSPQGQDFRLYAAHELPPTAGSRFPSLRPCANSLELGDCQWCQQGTKIKSRMCMRFYVHGILHTQLKDGELGTLALTTMHGYSGYWREINSIKLWDTSAWRDSPLDDILTIAEQADLTSRAFLLNATGVERNRRYKLIPLFNVGPLDANILQQALSADNIPTVDAWLAQRIEAERYVQESDESAQSTLNVVQSSSAVNLPAAFASTQQLDDAIGKQTKRVAGKELF